jgi:hypothetical protein
MGGAIGYGIVNAFLAFNHIHVYSKFDFIVSKGLNGWVGKNMMNLPLTIFSLLNIQWLLILICLIMFFKKDKLYYSSVVALLILNYFISFFTLDTTRIFSLISWGILLEVIFHSYQLSMSDEKDPLIQKRFIQALVIIGVLSFISPRYFSWEGNIYNTNFSTFIFRIFGGCKK